MNLKTMQSVKNKLKKYLENEDALDIIVFGSAVKGKAAPKDVDIAIITRKGYKIDIPGFHASVLKPEDFVINPPSIIHTLFREGYSLKNNKPFSEVHRFTSKVLYIYELANLKPAVRVKIVNILRGRINEKGLVKENSGDWLAKQVFIIPVWNDNIIEKFFLNFKVKFKKYYVLIH